MRLNFSTLLLAAAALVLPTSVFAATSTTNSLLNNAWLASYYANDQTAPQSDLVDYIGTFIQALLGILGVVFLILVVYAGVLWMTAGGNTDSVKKAKAILVNGVIGLILTTASYAIAYFVVGSLS